MFVRVYLQRHQPKRRLSLSKEQRCRKFMEEQAHQMEIHKWIESEKAKRDLGDLAMLEWVSKFAAIFRREWEAKYGPIIEDENGMCCSSCSGISARS